MRGEGEREREKERERERERGDVRKAKQIHASGMAVVVENGFMN